MLSQEVFKTSINVKLDIGEEEFLKSYLPTPSHADSIIGLTRGFALNGADSAHIMIGPYGSGKSLLATVIASIVGKAVNLDAVVNLINKFNRVHQDVYDSLVQLKDLEREYIPIILNGSYPDFGDNLIANIQRELRQNEIYIDLPTERNNVIKTITSWKANYPETYSRFLDILSKDFKRLKEWKNQIENGDREELDWFKAIYPDLSAGAKFDGNNDGNFQENLSIILNELKKANKGIFIVHDEFGRFLQNINQNKVYKIMQELQDLAEFVNRSDQYLQLLLISHKGMSRYMHGFTSEFQSEFQRIEERYTTYYVESDSATYYRIVQQYIEENLVVSESKIPKQKQTLYELRGFNLFQELNQHELEHLVVEGCNPIHPVTLFLLPRISKVFGQNERTLFTFLESYESGGLKNLLEENKEYIYPDHLFMYFFPEDSLSENYDERTESVFKTYQKIHANLDARKINAHRIVEFITLWQVTASNNVYKLDKSLISFATGIGEQRLNKLLNELSDLKFVRFNAVQELWELSEGSSVVIEDLIEDKKLDLKITSAERMKNLARSLSKKYYLARDYNDVKNITRFMKVQLINSAKFIEKSVKLKNLILDSSDGTVNLIVLDNVNDFNNVVAKIKSIKNRNIIFGILKRDLTNIKDILDNQIIIEKLLQDGNLISEYNNLKSELEVYKEGYQHEIELFLKSFTNFDNTVEWFYEGDKISVNNVTEIENIISNIMWNLYPETPIIMNDSINRYNVIGIQKRSLFEVTDRIINTHYQENIGITGQGPDYLIYATVFKNNEIKVNQLNKIQNVFLKSIRNALLDYLHKNEKGLLSELYQILYNSPYGIRPPLIPLLVITLLRDKWDQLMFYRNNMFVPALKGEKVYEMFKEAEKYEYVFYRYTEEMVTFMNQLEIDIKTNISKYLLAEETQVIRVSSGLLNWLRGLPRQTQLTTEFLTPEENHLKEMIRKSEVNPLSSIEELSTLYSHDYSKLRKTMLGLEQAHEKFKQRVLKMVCSKLEISSFEDKNQFIFKWDKNKQITSHLLSALSKSENIEEFSFNFIGTEIHDWSDINYELFMNQINNDIISLNIGSEVNENIFELYIDDDYKQIRKIELSKKSEVIYRNVKRIVDNAGRNLPKDEINFILLKLIKEHIK